MNASAKSDLLYSLLQSRSMACRILQAGLSVAAGAYGLAVALREQALARGYLSSHRLPAPVVSIGNITVGGTGKTPATIWVVQKLREMNAPAPVILSRGYGQDESKLLAERLPDIPHFTHPRRFLAGCRAIQELGHALCFVLDDGFQHRRLWRDLDIVLLDATRPFGFGHLLPRGLLREPVSRLCRADVILFTRCDQVAPESLETLSTQVRHLSPRALQARAIHAPLSVRELGQGPKYPPLFLAGKKCFVFAGIGNPGSFSATVRQMGASLAGQCFFKDHHAYSRSDLVYLSQAAEKSGADGLATTAKDAVKLAGLELGSLSIWVVDIEFRVCENEAGVLGRLRAAVGCR
jgi:tetraacyldisaccharide 4'-kinase